MAERVRRTRPSVADYETMVGDVGDLRAFALVSDLKSLTDAAEVSGESKATVSRRITRLEAALGTTLLRRSPRAIETTEEGALYRTHVGEVLALLGEANAIAQGARAAPSGQLRVAVPPGLSEPLARVFARFMDAFPRIGLSVQSSLRFVDIEAEQFDVALRLSPKLPDSSLVAHPVRVHDEESIVVAARSWVDRHGAPRRVADLASHRLLATHAEATLASVVFPLRENGTQTAVSLPVAFASSDLVLVRDLALAGAGVSVLPRMLVQPFLDDGTLVHLLPDVSAPGPKLYILHRASRFVPPKVKAFVTFVKENLFRAGTRDVGSRRTAESVTPPRRPSS